MTGKSVLSQMKIAVVDDHDLVREGLNAVLANNGADDVEKYSTATALMASLDAGKSYDFYIIDMAIAENSAFYLNRKSLCLLNKPVKNLFSLFG